MRALVPALVLLLLGGCGPSSELVAVAIAAHRNGAGDTEIRASVIAVDAGKHSADAAVEAAGTSASQAPEALIPLQVCRKIAGGPRGSSLTGFKLLDTGSPSLKTADGKHVVSLNTATPAAGSGTTYAGTFSLTDMPFTAGDSYTVTAGGGGDGPAFGAKIQSPPDFDVQKIGFASTGPGTLSIPSESDLEVDWTPGGGGGEMWIVIHVQDTGLACRVADTGSFVISQGLVGQLPKDTGTLTVERYFQADFHTSADASGNQLPGRIRFSEQREYKVQVQ